MSKDANINKKSKKTPVLLYRLFLKTCFASLVFLICLTIANGLYLKDTATVLALTLSIISAVLYELTYYFYKLNDNDLKYNIKGEPVKSQRNWKISF